ncbi:MAG: hypothetical protein QOE66_2684, partial [Chloroflexota bacterium]|nr:hypothetical protein [Chloroflexota bacterium]
HADPCRAGGFLEQDRDLGGLGLREQVDDPLRVCALGSGRGDVGLGQARPDDPPVVRALEPIEDDPEQPELRVGLVP